MDSQPEEFSASSNGTARIARLARSVALVLVVLAGVAILLQDLVGALPMGVQNQGRETWAFAARLTLGLMSVIAMILGADLLGWGARFRLDRIAGVVAGGVFMFAFLELSLALLDATVVSRGPGATLGGPYQEVRNESGEWVTFKKAHPASEFGFRTSERWREDDGELRVLFLGDSYTEGSGRAAACNYPEVAAARLATLLGRPVRALNAGVAGHGPGDSHRVLRRLVESGVRFDVIVHQLFLENDFTDNLPGTERRVMAGMLFRVPESSFLRTFHPMNGRSAHWTLLLAQLARGAGGGGPVIHRESGGCQLVVAAGSNTAPSAWTDAHMGERFRTNYGPDPRIAPEEVDRAQRALAAEAERLGVPLLRVVFPDRILADRDARTRLGIRLDAPGIEPDRLLGYVREVPGPLIYLGDTLAGGSENFASDTHLSDRGNVLAGAAVGDELGRWLASQPGSGRD